MYIHLKSYDDDDDVQCDDELMVNWWWLDCIDQVEVFFGAVIVKLV